MLEVVCCGLKQSADLERAPHVLLICPSAMHLYRAAGTPDAKNIRTQDACALNTRGL